MPRELNRFEADLICDNEYRKLKEGEERMEPCDLYDNCEDIWLFWEMAPSAYSKSVMGFNFEKTVQHKEIWTWSHPLWFKQGKP